jgi:hypothetical protein
MVDLYFKSFWGRTHFNAIFFKLNCILYSSFKIPLCILELKCRTALV